MALAEIPNGFAWSGLGLTYLTGFFLLLKAGNFSLSLLAAIPALSSLAAIPGGLLLDRCRGRKRVFLVTVTAAYLVNAFLGTVPYLLARFPPAVQVAAGIGLLATAYLLFKIQEVFWYAWSSALIPEERRGQFMGRLMIVVMLAQMPVSYLVGRYMDTANTTFGFLTLFLVCGLVGALVAVAYAQVPDATPAPADRSLTLRERFAAPLRDRGYRRFLIFLCATTLAGGLCGPFTTVFMLETLKIPYTHIALFGILYSIAFIASSGLWGAVVDKFGGRPVLLLCTAPAIGLSLLWLLCRPERVAWALVIFALSGITGAGVGLGQQTFLLRASSGPRSAGYIMMFQIALGLAGFAAPLLGGWIVEHLRWLDIVVWGYAFGPYHGLFAASAALWLLPTLLSLLIEEPRGRPMLFVLRNLVTRNPLRPAFN